MVAGVIPFVRVPLDEPDLARPDVALLRPLDPRRERVSF